METTAKVARLHPRAKALRGLVEDVENARTKWASAKMRCVGWSEAITELSRVSKVAKLYDPMHAFFDLREDFTAAKGRWEALGALRMKWLDARKAIRPEGSLDALDAKAKRLRKIVEKGQASRAKLESLRLWGLTYQGTMATLVKSRTEAVELAAKRPATCPYCGAGNHKGEGC
jgi:hypothetical protein